MSHDRPTDEPDPARAAVATAVALLVVLWAVKFGGRTLLLVPLLGVWVRPTSARR